MKNTIEFFTIDKNIIGKNSIEKRANDPSWDALSGLNTGTGSLIDPRTAEQLAAVSACVQVISSAIASLPVYVYRREGSTKIEDEAHALATLVKRGPNTWQGWPDWMEWTMSQVLLRGNALSEIKTDGAGRIVGIWPIPWEWVSVSLLPDKRIAYDITELVSIYGGNGRLRRLLDTEVLHLRDRSDNGLLGVSRLRRAAETFQNGIEMQSFSKSTYANGVNPSGVLTHPGSLSEEAHRKLRESMNAAHTGTRNARKTLILEDGMTWTTTSFSPEDAELLSSRRFSREEIASIFNVPPPLVGIWDHSSFTNSETAGKWFGQFTILPWLKKLEGEFSRSGILSEGNEIEFDLSGFMRGDHGARWTGYQIAITEGVLTPNEIREQEGFNPISGGDTLRGHDSANDEA
jgi:HK97 family phage portal protein